MKKNKTWKIVGIVAIVVLVLIGAFAAYRYKTAKPQANESTAETATVVEPAAVAPGEVEKQYMVFGPGMKLDQFIPATPMQHAAWRSKLDSAKAGKPADLKFLGLPAGTKVDSFRVVDREQDKAPQKSIWQKSTQWLKGHWYWLALVAVVVVAVILVYRNNHRPLYSFGGTATPAATTTTPAATANYSKTRWKFAWFWIVLAVACLTYASYLAGPEIQDHRFFPLLVIGIFSIWPAWRAFARIPYGKKAVVPTVGQFFKKIFVSGPACTAIILILFYLMIYNRLN